MAWIKGMDRGIVFVKNKDVKAEIVKCLNAVGIFGEKVAIDDFSDFLKRLKEDNTLKYSVVVGSSIGTGEIDKFCEFLGGEGKDKFQRNLLFFEPEQEALKTKFEGKLPSLTVSLLPIQKREFTVALIGIPGAATPVATKPEGKVEAAKAEAPKRPENATFAETTEHLKKTIDDINAISKDRTQVAAMLDIAQRFNGIVGTFAFFKQSDGYKQLFVLAKIIDDIGRTYEKSEAKEIDVVHFDLVVRSAKCAFLILKSLRANQPVEAPQQFAVDTIEKMFNKADGILKRESQSQEDIDSMLENYKSEE